ncbi:MAG: Ig-like domain-containing protein [Verrucomicrobiota bacterium]
MKLKLFFEKDATLRFATADLEDESNLSRLRSNAPCRSFHHFIFLLSIFFFSASPQAATIIVNLSSFQFVPKDLTVNVGDTVTWTNLDNVLHDTTSGTNRVPSGVWHSPLFGKGDTFSFTFTNAGFYSYYCTPHAQIFNMVGSVTVTLPNVAPTVNIIDPPAGTNFRPGENIVITAEAFDDTSVRRVEFFANGIFIGTDFFAPYSATVTNAAAGIYSLTAIAFDDQGASTLSVMVKVSALASPTITISQPASFSRFGRGTNILLVAEVNAPGLLANSVQFFEREGLQTSAISPRLTDAPFHFFWSPAFGTHIIFAVATDERGGTNVSPEVNIEVFEPGTKNPTISITNAPKNFARVPVSPVFIGGVASDDVRLERIEFQVNGGPFLPANGTNRWSAAVELAAGTNLVVFRSVDFAGNFSTTTSRVLVYVVNAPLTVVVRGLGLVSPDLNQRKLEIEKYYRVTARAGAGQIFGGWEGAAISNKAVLNFQMQSNLVLTAHFIPNPFPALKGIYIGEFFATDEARPENSGVVLLQLTSRGSFSGRLTVNGRRFALSGQFDFMGHVRLPVLRRPIQPVVLDLQLDLQGTRAVEGTVSDGDWIANLNAAPAMPK